MHQVVRIRHLRHRLGMHKAGQLNMVQTSGYQTFNQRLFLSCINEIGFILQTIARANLINL